MASRFVQKAQEKRTPTPGQSGQNVRADRVDATKGLKITRMNPANAVAVPPVQPAHKKMPSGTAPAPGYTSNQYGDRNTFPNHQYHQEDYHLPPDDFPRDPALQRPAFDEVTVDSEFDITRSESAAGYDQRGVDNMQDGILGDKALYDGVGQSKATSSQNTNGAPVQTLHHKQTMFHPQQMSHITQPVLQAPLIPVLGRGVETYQKQQNHTSRQIENLQYRGGPDDPLAGRHDRGSKKRNHSGEGARGHVSHAMQPHHLSEESDNEDLELSDDLQALDNAGFPNGNIQTSSQSTGRAASTPESSPNRARKSRTIPRSQLPSSQPRQDPAPADNHQCLPDYDDEELKNMTYKDLEEESLETVPHAEVFAFPMNLRGPEVTFEQRLEHYVEAPDKEQSAFFESLTNAEWEKAGDWFIDQFSGCLNDFKGKRQAKRAQAAQFEDEIKTRERLVRARANKYDSDLNGMAGIGQQLLRNKVV